MRFLLTYVSISPPSETGYMESTMDATTSMTTPPEDVDNLMRVCSFFFEALHLLLCAVALGSCWSYHRMGLPSSCPNNFCVIPLLIWVREGSFSLLNIDLLSQQMVADEAGLQLAGQLDAPGTHSVATAAGQQQTAGPGRFSCSTYPFELTKLMSFGWWCCN